MGMIENVLFINQNVMKNYLHIVSRKDPAHHSPQHHKPGNGLNRNRVL